MKHLLFLHHVSTLPEDTLANEVLVEKLTKAQWKNLINIRIFEMNKDDILIQMKPYKKIRYAEKVKDKFEV